MPAGQHKRLHPFERSFQLVLLDRPRGINMLRANPRALPNKRTSPDALRMCQQPQSLLRALIAIIQVVPLRERKSSRPNKSWFQSHHRTSRIAKRAIDAHAELLVEIQLLRRLQEFAGAKRWLVLADQPWLNALQLDHEIAQRR